VIAGSKQPLPNGRSPLLLTKKHCHPDPNRNVSDGEVEGARVLGPCRPFSQPLTTKDTKVHKGNLAKEPLCTFVPLVVYAFVISNQQ
jgi:hypothetical protein